METAVLAVTAAIGLIAIDVIFVCRGTISPIYLADAIAEFLMMIGWSVVSYGERFRDVRPASDNPLV